MLGPAHRVVAEEDVADGAAAQGGEEGDEADAEQVHVAATGSEGAGHGFCTDGDQVDRGKHTELLRCAAPPPVLCT